MFSIRSTAGLQRGPGGRSHLDARVAAGFKVDLVKAPYAGRAMPPVRRLTAILAADVAGYSRLMGADEEGTHERLKAHLRDLVEPKIKEHRGRIVKNTGDGFLAEFPSVVDAVRCATEIQRGMADREPGVPEELRIRFRIGINLGDVIADGDDIFGDGVNVGARLEALAHPGGICISRMVRDNVRDKLDFGFEDLGEQQVKNIARPVRVYRVRDRAILTEAPAAIHQRRVYQGAAGSRDRDQHGSGGLVGRFLGWLGRRAFEFIREDYVLENQNGRASDSTRFDFCQVFLVKAPTFKAKAIIAWADVKENDPLVTVKQFDDARDDCRIAP
jgi:class 3 adenylate cyclase